MVADDPAQPYTVFTRDFDVECHGREVPENLYSSFIGYYPGEFGPSDFEERLRLALEAFEEAKTELALIAQLTPPPKGEAVTILIDQSGSMADRMSSVAGYLRAVVETLERQGFTVSMLGHTTRGWQGGRSRAAWKKGGRPSRPGRLNDLLHVVYKEFDSEMAEEDWAALLWPQAVLENIDGEALAWAVKRLQHRSESEKIVIVLSDGASVDDSTLLENGSGFLERHLQHVIGEIEADSDLRVCAVGVEHWVERYYQHSVKISEVTELPSAIASLIGERISQSAPTRLN